MSLLLTIALLAALGPAGMAQDAPIGTVAGMVYDASTGQPIVQVTVEVVGLPGKKAVSTVDGAFKFTLPPGTYSLMMTSEKHLAAQVEGVVVTAYEVADASTVMAPASLVTTVDVVEKISAVAATAETMIAERRLAQTVSDGISGLEIRAGTASDAAAALQQVTGVSLVDGGLIYVRGLGERYSSTRLNNAMLTTTEPERRVVPLDLFPAGLIDSIQVKKTYTPDMPGEFAAGLVQIKTTEFPAAPMVQVNYSIGFNDRTQFKRFLRYPGGGRDFWGFDDGTRGLPDFIPRDTRVDRFNFSPKELQQMGRALPNNWAPVLDDSARPSQNFGIVAGGTFGKLGLVGAFQFSNTLQSIFDQDRIFYQPNPGGPEAGPPLAENIFNYDESTVGARMGAILNASYQLSPAHKLTVRNFLSRDTDNNTRFYTGFYDDFETDVRNARLRWVERSLYSVQFGGEHFLRQLANSIMTWQLGYSNARRDEPDLRENLYLLNEVTGKFEYFDDSQSAFRMYNVQDETIWNPSIDWMTPFYKGGLSGSVKFGADVGFRRRDFLSRRLRFALRGSRGIDPTLPPNDLLAPENIRPTGFELAETTRITDAYEGKRDVVGGYGMVDLSLSPKWRLIGGLRVENVDQDVITFDPFNPERARIPAPFRATNYLPGVNLIYHLTPKHNIRFGFSQTVSRPDFRELALFDFLDIVGGRQTVGNPDLRQTQIRNFDARWEYFPGGNQLVAASFFCKRFDDPIERVIRATVGLLTSFDNADSARNFGFELEFRRGLDFVTPRLRPFAVSANFTFIDSTIDLSGVKDTVLTSRVRPMQGQSRYVTNLITEWSRPRWRSTARFYLNYFSSRIADVGAFGLPDVIQQGVTTLDFVYEYDLIAEGKCKLRFSAENLGDPAWHWTQGGLTFQRWNLGRTFKIGTSFRIY